MTSTLSPIYHSVCTKLNLLCPRVSLLHVKKATFSSIHKNRKATYDRHVCTSNIFMRQISRLPGSKPEITKQQAEELTLRLTSEERALLLSTLQEYQSKLVKDEYLGESYIYVILSLYYVIFICC